MKPIAVFVLVAAFSLVTVAASARNASAPQSDSDRVVNTLAGPAPSANHAKAATAQPSKKELRKSRIKAKPPLRDPN